MKDTIFIIFAGITGLFFMGLLAKTVIKKQFCTLCMSVSMTWLSLLILYWTKYFANPIILALLIGNSIVGIYYLIEKKIQEKFFIFRLPFFLSMVFIGYSLIQPKVIVESVATEVLLGVLWVIFGFFYFYRNNPKLQKGINALINCCKNW